ncbi:unnamed protein product [marine sediment metagenome]|uniref:Uncharacterized protein n=1 Tax=marine sediment metagenome TaxID=412755 RepID=X0T2U7_9ZZZZ
MKQDLLNIFYRQQDEDLVPEPTNLPVWNREWDNIQHQELWAHFDQMIKTLDLAPTPNEIRDHWETYLLVRNAREDSRYEDRKREATAQGKDFSKVEEPYYWTLSFADAMKDGFGDDLREFYEWWVEMKISFYRVWGSETGATLPLYSELMKMRRESEASRRDVYREHKRKKKASQEAIDDLI